MFEILIFWNLNLLIIRMNLDGEITKTEVVDLNEIYNFVADDLSIWNHLWFQNSVLCSYILKFKNFKLFKQLGWRNYTTLQYQYSVRHLTLKVYIYQWAVRP